MTRDARLVAPGQTIAQAALVMHDYDVRCIAVAEGGKLIGMLTARRVAVCATANGKGTQTLVREAMSDQPQYCYADDMVDEVAADMARLQIRCVPVVDDDMRLVGFVATNDIAGPGVSDANAATLPHRVEVRIRTRATPRQGARSNTGVRKQAPPPLEHHQP